MSGLIGVDWGSTNLRAFRFDAAGRVVDRRSSPRGAAGLAPGAFAAELVDTVGDWSSTGTRIVLAGMVGGRAGWRETPYLPCPVAPAELAAAALRIDTPLGPALVVPGLSSRSVSGAADVMRGEETQLLGARLSDGLVILPGTHSKWATLEQGRIVGFTTAMTGELYALLRRHSLLGQLAAADAAFDAPAFERGVRRVLAAGTIVPLLFSARADVLLGELAPAAVESYLSGLLIGGEIAAFRPERATLIASPVLIQRYRVALRIAGIDDVRSVDGDDAVARGLWTIGECL